MGTNQIWGSARDETIKHGTEETNHTTAPTWRRSEASDEI
jgi:hypothetical protein